MSGDRNVAAETGTQKLCNENAVERLEIEQLAASRFTMGGCPVVFDPVVFLFKLY